MDKIFGVLEAAQSDEIKSLCFGVCGQIIANRAVQSPRLGPIWLCRQQTCPYKRAETDEPIGEIQATGEQLYLRTITTPPTPT
jgi:hypothetical protein